MPVDLPQNDLQEALQVLSDISLSMSTAINVLLRKVAREHRIPFELSADAPNAENEDRSRFWQDLH